MLLVGSRALDCHIKLDRILHDWDFFVSDQEWSILMNTYYPYLVKETPGSTLFDIKGKILEIKKESQFTATDKHIFDQKYLLKVETPFGLAYIPDIQTIYIMKCATAKYIDEWKHKYDQKIIEDNFQNFITLKDLLYDDRLFETHLRVNSSKKNKYSFFHKNAFNNTKISTIPEYIVHDRLHDMIADLVEIPVPTYIKTINGDVETDINMFYKLTFEEKVSLMAEESLVLALERWFVPQMVENGINYRLIEKFYNNNEAGPTFALLKHVNVKGLIGEHPEIVQFGRDNFNKIEEAWVEMKVKIKKNGGLQQWFFDEIFAARDKYRKGEKVGIHHE